MEMIKWLFIMHILFLLVLLLLRKARILQCDYIILWVAFLIPVWGEAMLLLKDASDRRLSRTRGNVEAARIQPDEIMKRVKTGERDNPYGVNRSIVMDADDVMEKVVPLNEALVFNDSAIRRALIMDVLYSNPGDYIPQLTEAKSNDDTEVVHYAVTALVQLQKEFDQRFHDIFQRKEENPNDASVNQEYLKVMEEYISSGLLEGESLNSQLMNYKALLLERIERGERDRLLLCKLADVDLKLKDVAHLSGVVEEMMKRWPEQETTYLYRIKLGALLKRADAIGQVIDELERKEVYQSARLRDCVQFWSRKNEEKIGS